MTAPNTTNETVHQRGANRARNSRRNSLLAGLCFAGALALCGSGYAVEEETGPGNPYSPLPTDKVVVTKVKHFGVMTWKIAAAGGTFYFENGNDTGGSTGFSSAFDQAGNDWIGADNEKGFNKVPGAPGWGHKTRGFPKFTGGAEFETPTKKTGAKTRWLDKDGKDIEVTDKLEGQELIMRSFNASNEVEYHFYPSHVAIKIIKMEPGYCFHFQGLIGGEPEKSPKDYYVLKDGVKRDVPMGGAAVPADVGSKKWPSPFIYMVDSDEKDTQVFYMGAKNLPADYAGDEGWMATGPNGILNIQIFSYGRANDKRTLTGTDEVFIFGFQPKNAGHEKISKAIEGYLAEPFKAGPVSKL
jgi:hypothetical protein